MKLYYSWRDQQITRWIAFLTIASSALFSCRAQDLSSDVKYGFKTGEIGNGPATSFYHVLPNQSVAVCNPSQQINPAIVTNVAQAVPYWLQPLGRDPYVKVIDGGCQGDWIINLMPTANTAYAQTWPLQGNTVMMEIGSSFVLNFTNRHEMGHVFGFCDLYMPQYCSNNSNNPGLGNLSASLMGSGNLNGGERSDEDTRGIFEIIKTPELAEDTAKWDQFLKDQNPNVQTPNSSDSGSSSNVASNTTQGSGGTSGQAVTINIVSNNTSPAPPTYGPDDPIPGNTVPVTIGGTSTDATVTVATANGPTPVLSPMPSVVTNNIVPVPMVNVAPPGTLAANTTIIPNPVIVGSTTLLTTKAAAQAPPTCLCTHGQEGGCGVTKNGQWLNTHWFESAYRGCDEQYCRTVFADIVADQCGNSIATDPMFH